MDSYYPLHDPGPFIAAAFSGGLRILHLCLLQMAAGGGILLCYFERLRQRGRSKYAGRFITGYFQDLVLISFMLAALVRLAMWLAAIRLSPRAAGAVFDQLHWVWATEWTFFCLEVVSGYAYLRYQERTSGRDRLFLLVSYSVAIWMSLFWISGIESSQIDPGRWMPAHASWHGFFNPSFWPLLGYRTVAAIAIAALGACFMINISWPLDREARRDLMGHAARFVAPLVLLPPLGAWLWATLPKAALSWGSEIGRPVIIFMSIVLVASFLAGVCGLGACRFRKLELSLPVTVLLCLLVLAASAGGELVCQLARQPVSIDRSLVSGSHPPDGPAKGSR